MPKTAGKHKLLNIENQYQKLQYILNTFGSARIKLEHLRLFLYELVRDKNNIVSFSYFDELITNYIGLITANNIEYRSIDRLMSLKFIEETFIGHNIKEIESTDFKNAQKILSNQIVLACIYLGEWQQGLRVFFPNLKQNDFKKVFSNLKQDLSNASESTVFQKYVRTLGKDTLKKNKNVKTVLDTLKSWEDILTKTQNGNTWVLLIEYESQDVFRNTNQDRDIVAIGNIQQLDANAHRLVSDSAQDFVLFNNLSLSYNDLLYQQANIAIKVAKDNLDKSISKSNNKYNVIYSFLKKESYYSGESLGLAMTLSTISSISKNTDYKYKYSLVQDYCITGSIAPDGAVNSISVQALTTKLETVFYSPFNKILMPEGNIKQALAELDKLKEKYPHRDLEIIAVENIKEALSKPKIVLKEKTSFRNRLPNNLAKRSIPSIIIIAIILFFSAIMFLNKDINPTDLQFNESSIDVYNKSGNKLWTYDFGYKLNLEYYKIYPNKLHERKAIFIDIDKDGLNELILGTTFSEQANGGLIVFDNTGQILWKYTENFKNLFSHIGIDNVYRNNSIFIYNDGDEIYIIANMFHRLYFPSHTVIFNSLGEIKGEYWNAGHVYAMAFVDIDDDNEKEIIFGGCDNAHNSAFVGVLEFDNVKGHSPTSQANYIPNGVSKGTEVYYILLPQPKELLNAYRGEVMEIRVLPDSNITVQYSLDSQKQLPVSLILNNEFNMVDFTISDAYKYNYKRLVGRDFNADYPPELLQKMFSDFRYWNGEKFVSEPVMSNQN